MIELMQIVGIEGYEWVLYIVLLFLLLPVVLLVASIVITIKFPTIGMAFGVVDVIVGLIFLMIIRGLSGIPQIIGIALLSIGFIVLFTGYYSKRKYSKRKELQQVPKSEPTSEAMDQLKKLKELLDMGAITEVEYEEKRKKLLSKI